MLLFLVAPCLVVAVQPCMEWIPILKKINFQFRFLKMKFFFQLLATFFYKILLFKNSRKVQICRNLLDWILQGFSILLHPVNFKKDHLILKLDRSKEKKKISRPIMKVFHSWNPIFIKAPLKREVQNFHIKREGLVKYSGLF